MTIYEEITIKINFNNCTYIDWDDCNTKFKDTNLPLNGKYEDENGTVIRHFKNGKLHNENGPAIIRKDGYKRYYINGKPHRIDGPASFNQNGKYYWWINGHKITNETMNIWLEENDIPLDWNIWTNEDKMLFALNWSDYTGI